MFEREQGTILSFGFGHRVGWAKWDMWLLSRAQGDSLALSWAWRILWRDQSSPAVGTYIRLIRLIHLLIMTVATSFLLHFTKVQRAYAIPMGRLDWLTCVFLPKVMLWQRVMFLEKQWKSSLQSDCDCGHGPLILILGRAKTWREDVPLLLSLSANHLGDWGIETLQHIIIFVLP